MAPEDIIVEVWRRELGGYVAERMLRQLATSTVSGLRAAGWELVSRS
jgi:hypothetical protein